MRRNRLGMVLCLAAAAALAGCGGTGRPEQSGQYGQEGRPNQEGQSGEPGGAAAGQGTGSGDAIICYVGHGFWDSPLDPVKGAFSYGWSFVNNALLRVKPDSSYEGDLAESWEVSDDALTYTFHLREGVKFHDGSDFDAEDVVFTYETVKENQGDNEKVDLSRMASVKALDSHTVEIALTEPFSPFLDETAQLGIVPSDGYDSLAFNEKPVGTGAWKVVQYDPQQQLIVEANQDYFDGAPHIRRVSFVNMDNEAAFSNARSGQLDVVMVQPNYASEPVEGMRMEKLATMDVRNISLPCRTEQKMVRPGGGEVGVGDNATADLAVRTALNIGIDREEIIQNAYNGVGKPAFGFGEGLEWGNADTLQDGRAEEAVEILEEAGWVDSDGDGVREKGPDLCSFEVYTPSDEQDRYSLAVAFAESAKPLGIEVVVRQTTWDEITAASYQAGVVWGFGQFNPIVLDQLFHSRHFLAEDFANTPGFDNGKADRLIEEAVAAADHGEAVRKWREMQAVIEADVPYLYLVNIEHCYFISDRLDISPGTQVPHPHGHGIPIICNMKDWRLR